MGSPSLQKFIGMIVKCEDGVTREIKTIEHSFARRTMCVINEFLEDGPGFVNYLNLSYQHAGEPLPDPDSEIARVFQELGDSLEVDLEATQQAEKDRKRAKKLKSRRPWGARRLLSNVKKNESDNGNWNE